MEKAVWQAELGVCNIARAFSLCEKPVPLQNKVREV